MNKDSLLPGSPEFLSETYTADFFFTIYNYNYRVTGAFGHLGNSFPPPLDF